MRDIDDTDRELLRLLLEDARRPYSELAEAVDLSPPAVSDRVDRLVELGVIERFTLGLDRSRLADDSYPAFGEATLGLECAECGNTVTSEGVATKIGGDRHEFCCESCETRFRERYEELREGT